MADFLTLAEADARAQAKVKDGTWVEAYSFRGPGGQPKVRFLRRMTATNTTRGTFDGMNNAGSWDETASTSVT